MPAKAANHRHLRITAGVELESYTITTPDYAIGRTLAFPRKGLSERGERFGRDWSIGTEYNSRPFTTIREGLFLLKAGLRKYSQRLYRSKKRTHKGKQLLLVGGWRDRFAGAHIHLSISGEHLTKADARSLSAHLHDHIPLLIAMGANSPVWGDEITRLDSNRILKASQTYFRPVRRNELTSRSWDEALYNKGRKTKPATLELRILDSNVPDYVMACVTVVKAAALAWLDGKGAPNRLRQADYTRTRADAAARGMKARLIWNGKPVSVSRYLDHFVWAYREELASMDVPQELWTVFKLLKRGLNGAEILREAAEMAHREHPQTWQRRFAKRYVKALDSLLAGNTILDFASALEVKAPDVRGTRLGRRNLNLL